MPDLHFVQLWILGRVANDVDNDDALNSRNECIEECGVERKRASMS